MVIALVVLVASSAQAADAEKLLVRAGRGGGRGPGLRLRVRRDGRSS
jgi:hypothetical protein